MCSTSLISSALSHDRLVRREHLFEQRRAAANLFRQRDEIVEEPLFARDQSEAIKPPPLHVSRYASDLTDSTRPRLLTLSRRVVTAAKLTAA